MDPDRPHPGAAEHVRAALPIADAGAEQPDSLGVRAVHGLADRDERRHVVGGIGRPADSCGQERGVGGEDDPLYLGQRDEAGRRLGLRALTNAKQAGLGGGIGSDPASDPGVHPLARPSSTGVFRRQVWPPSLTTMSPLSPSSPVVVHRRTDPKQAPTCPAEPPFEHSAPIGIVPDAPVLTHSPAVRWRCRFRSHDRRIVAEIAGRASPAVHGEAVRRGLRRLRSDASGRWRRRHF